MVKSNIKPSIAKPWLKYYTDEQKNKVMPICSLYDYLYDCNKDYLHGIAINYFNTEITYRQLFENIQKTAQAFLEIGVRDGDIIPVITATTPEIVYTFYAMDLIGAVPNMIDPRYSAEGIKEYIEEVDAKFVCCLDVAYDKVKEAVKGTKVEKVVVVSPADSLPALLKVGYKLTTPDKNVYDENAILWKDFINMGGCRSIKAVENRANKPCCIVHTGGTTGSSKCVMLCDNNYNALAFQIGNCQIRFKRGQRFLNVMPPFIAYGFGYGIHLPIACGVTTVIIPQLDPLKLAGLIRKYRPEHMAGVPAHYQFVMHDKKMRHFDLDFMVNACAGGDSISLPAEEAVNNFLKSHNCQYNLTKGYGMTEMCAVACACMSDVNKLGSVGVPLLNTTISTFDPETGEELPIGEEGEICISGPTMMLGYYEKPEETANVIRKHADGMYWVHTGDLGHIDEDGFVFIAGRIKRVIIRHDGFKVFPYLIENVVSKHPSVEVCAAVATKDTTKPQGKLPSVHIVLTEDNQLSEDQVKQELIQLCEKELPEYVQPSFYRFDNEMPYTAIGKIDFRALERIEEELVK